MKERALRYALLRHECRSSYRDGSHWDLMFERADLANEHRLATWSMLALPDAWAERLGLEGAGESVSATRLSDHRAIYLDYEGQVAGDRGSVCRVASGKLSWLEASEDLYRVALELGTPLEGVVSLQADSKGIWQLHCG